MPKNKPIDLSVFQDETINFILPDKKEVHLMKPTKGLVIEMAKFQHMGEDTPPSEVDIALNAMALMLLNNNDANTVFDGMYVARLNVAAKTALLANYAQWIIDIENRPN